MKAASAKKKKVLIALSGGIDSAVSAYLLIKQGYEVEAAFMRNWSKTAGLKVQDCPWLQDRQDALRVAAFLGIPIHTLDFEKQYGQTVMKYFFDQYWKGLTPNPDVMCNKEIKFKLLYNWAIKNGFDYLATGHYARVVKSKKLKVKSKNNNFQLSTFNFQLARSADEFKDQTYFIYNIRTHQLAHLLFPIGGMKKKNVRLLARKIGLPNAEKRESMGLCFVGKIRLKDFLEQKLKAKPGNIILVSDVMSSRNFSRVRSSQAAKNIRPARQSFSDGGDPEQGLVSGSRLSPHKFPMSSAGMEEKIIGIHQGLHNYTIGQRQGINVGGGGPYYVVKKDLKTNTLFVTNNPDDPALSVREIQIHSANWIAKIGNSEKRIENRRRHLPYLLVGRYRHQGELVPLTVSQIKNDLYRVVFAHPQKAVASGQSLVLYKGKECVGGGVIV